MKFCLALILLTAQVVGCPHLERSYEMSNSETPKYLYKILSHRHWLGTQARKALILSSDDDAFIHFSKEDQLERILAKYWSDIPQFAILKIDTSQLKGNLVYEANPGGLTKYYHLYEGFIPFESIVETKVIGESASEKLDIVEIGASVLRTPARSLTPEEILSPEIQALIEKMKITMREAPGVGLAAPQIGLPYQLTVVEDQDHSHLTPQQLAERERYPVPFQVIINPTLHIEGTETANFFEGCLSIPQLMGIVPRAKSVRVECLNERAEPVTIHATGWHARILQHEIDHLNGTLYIDKAHPRTIMTEESYSKEWKTKSIAEILAH